MALPRSGPGPGPRRPIAAPMITPRLSRGLPRAWSAPGERAERLRASLERAQVAYQAGCSAQAARDLLRAQDEFQMCARMAPGFRDVTARAAALREAVMRADDLYRRAAAAESRADRERARILF